MKRLFPRVSIRVRLLLASTVVQVLLLTVLLANSVRLVHEATTASLETLAAQNAAMLHALVTAYGEQDRYPALQAVLEALTGASDDGLVYVRIGGSDARLLAAAGLPAMTALPPPDASAAGGARLGRVVHIRRPLALTGGEAGFVQFGVAARPLAAARSALIEQGSAIALAEILLTLLLLSTVGYLLTRKLGQLLAASQALALGRLDHPLPAEGEDELARLARHFNAMAATVQTRIDDLQDSAERLRASEQRHALALRGADDGLWDWDIESDTVYCSPRYVELAGLCAERPHHRAVAIFERIHPQDAEDYRSRLVEHLRGASAQFICEYRVRQSDGGYRWVFKRGMALRGGDGRAFRMTGLLSDIHARKLAETLVRGLAGQAEGAGSGARHGGAQAQALSAAPTQAQA